MKIHPFSLERYFSAHEFTAKYLLGSSDPESMTLQALLSLEPGAEAALQQLWLGYTEYHGHPALRAAISDLYHHVSAEEVLVFTGAEEPIFAFMNVVLQPGDHVIVQSPCYQSHLEVAGSLGAEVSSWVSRFEAGWAPDLEELKRLLRPNTKVLVVNSPHNPTGYHFDEASWLALVQIAREHGLWLFSDEVYQGLEQAQSLRLLAACDLYERGVSLHGVSKAYGLAGLRIGWLVTHDRALFQALSTFKDYLTICNAAPSELLATIAVKHSEQLFARSVSQLQENLAHLEAFVERRSTLFQWVKPRAGSTTLIYWKPKHAVAFCDDLLRDTGIMLIPSTHFSFGDEFLRFGYGRKNFQQVLQLLDEYLQRADV
jgi:aspartate/methionine/tyrosine aminotransferase